MPYVILLILLKQEAELKSLFVLMHSFFKKTKNEFSFLAVYHSTSSFYWI